MIVNAGITFVAASQLEHLTHLQDLPWACCAAGPHARGFGDRCTSWRHPAHSRPSAKTKVAWSGRRWRQYPWSAHSRPAGSAATWPARAARATGTGATRPTATRATAVAPAAAHHALWSTWPALPLWLWRSAPGQLLSNQTVCHVQLLCTSRSQDGLMGFSSWQCLFYWLDFDMHVANF